MIEYACTVRYLLPSETWMHDRPFVEQWVENDTRAKLLEARSGCDIDSMTVTSRIARPNKYDAGVTEVECRYLVVFSKSPSH